MVKCVDKSLPVLSLLFFYFDAYLCVQCLYLLCNVLCERCWGVVLKSVTLCDEALYFWCEIRVVFSSVASGDVMLVCVLYNCVEFMYSSVDVCDGCTVQYLEVLFCFINEGIPVGSFVISVSVSVASWGESCLCTDYDGQVIRP